MKVIYAILLTMFTATAYAQTEISSFQLEGDSIRIENSIITHSNTSGDLFPLPILSAPRIPLIFTNINYHKYKSYADSTVQIPSLSFTPGQSDCTAVRDSVLKPACISSNFVIKNEL